MAWVGPARNLQHALLSLARTPLAHLEAAIDHLLMTSARTLEVERVSLWLALPDGRGIAGHRLYTRDGGFASFDTELLAEQYPHYFEALRSTLALAADDAQRDPRTAPFAEDYLQPNRITAMLDVPVKVFGRPFGIICHEQVGEQRAWDESEQVFAAAVGMMASLAYEQDEHRRTAQAHENSRLYDAMTGLAARSLFVDRLQQALQQGRPTAVLVLDLDRFRVVNESLGHVYGDALLIETARRLQAAAPKNASLGRLGNDEFAILLDDVAEAVDAMRAAERVLAAIAEPRRLGGQSLVVTGSIGIALGSGRREAAHLLREAEAALNRARVYGGARHELFDSSMYEASAERLKLDGDLRRALDRRELHTAYQPIVDTATGAIRGFEALARWQHGERGAVPPAQFIPACEEIGLIGRLGALVLDDALAELVRWRALGVGDELVASVNVSPLQLASPTLAEEVAAALERHGLAGGALSLEITESSLIELSPAVRDTLARLHAIGVRLNLDDFGTGYGFLTHLRTLPIAAVKIDRSFTAALPDDRAAVAIATALVQLAHGLDIGVIAEGVETPEQFAFLRALGCESAQGYWLGRPQAASAFDAAALAAIGERARRCGGAGDARR